jgi:hypothetical protein
MAELAITPLMGDSSLKAYWRLEDLNDSKGTSTLTNNNSVTFTAAKFNNGANFGTANANKNLLLGGASPFGITSNAARTLSFWAKMNTELSGGDSYGCFLAMVHADIDIVFRIGYWRASGINSINFDRGKLAIATLPISSNINLGTINFNHFVLTWDGSTLKGYFNGTLINSSTPSGSGNNGFTDEIRIGSDFGGNNPISATVDDVSIFSRALTADEVLTIYKEQSASFFMFM